MQPESKPPTRYRLQVVKASGIVWDSRLHRRDPNPYVEIVFDETPILKTATKKRTLAPEWNEEVELPSSVPASKLSLILHHRSTIPGRVLSIGSKEITVQELRDQAVFNSNVSLDLHDGDRNVGVLAIRFVREGPPAVKPPVYVPPELRPDSMPAHPADPTKVLQVVGFQEQDVSMDQATRIVRQILARSSA